MRAGNLAFRLAFCQGNKTGPETVRTGQLVKIIAYEVSDHGMNVLDFLGA